MPFARWWEGLQHKLSRGNEELHLNHRNLYILPSSFGGLWLLTSGVLYILGINSRSNGPVLLAMGMAALMVLSLFLTHLNLQGLQLKAVPQRPCLAGETTAYEIEAQSQSARPSLKWRWIKVGAPEQQCIHLEPGKQRIGLAWESEMRGRQQPGRLVLHTTAPIGLFRCWCYWEPPQEIWVAPRPRPGPVEELKSELTNGGDLFDGVRPWRKEEGWRRVDWKALARGRGRLSKKFSNEEETEVWLTTAAQIPLERALEHLCERVLRESRSGREVGLVFPDGDYLEPQKDRDHVERCLRALAEWPQ